MVNAEQWRERAAEVLAQAQFMTNPISRRALLDIAAGYERLARRRAERLHDDRLAPKCVDDLSSLP